MDWSGRKQTYVCKPNCKGRRLIRGSRKTLARSASYVETPLSAESGVPHRRRGTGRLKCRSAQNRTLEPLKSVAFPQPAQTGTNMQTKIPLSRCL